MRKVLAVITFLAVFSSLPAQTYTKVHYLRPEGDKAEQVDAMLVFGDRELEIRNRKNQQPIAGISYDEIDAFTYSKSKHPRWKSGIGVAIAVGVFALPIFFMKGKKHWLSMQHSNEMTALRLDKNNYTMIIGELEAKTGMKLDWQSDEIASASRPETKAETVAMDSSNREILPATTPRPQSVQPISGQPMEAQVEPVHAPSTQVASPPPASTVGSEPPVEATTHAGDATAGDNSVWQQILNSAQEGDPQAQFLVGRRLAEGDGVPVNYAEAAKWFHLAAQKGHTEAQENLGVMYANGRGVAQDYAEAVLWYEKAAKSGNPEVQAELGDIYFFGRGGMKDHRRAKQWYEMAAVNGIPRAQFNLGLMYANGQGTSVDYVKAYTWLTAATQLPILAEKAIEARQSFAGSMTAAQIAQAERDAQAYMP